MFSKLGNVQLADGRYGGDIKKRRIERVRLGKEKVYMLVYTDDMVVLAKDKE